MRKRLAAAHEQDLAVDRLRAGDVALKVSSRWRVLPRRCPSARQVVPWPRLDALIEPHYPKAGPKGGRPPMPLEVMLRVYCLQQWYALSDPAAEEALYDSDAMRRFAGLELGDDAIPDETTILNFRHLLERHELTRAIFEAVNAYLREKGILLREGTLVDATLIDAPSSTKNKQRARDPEKPSRRGRSGPWSKLGSAAFARADLNVEQDALGQRPAAIRSGSG